MVIGGRIEGEPLTSWLVHVERPPDVRLLIIVVNFIDILVLIFLHLLYIDCGISRVSLNGHPFSVGSLDIDLIVLLNPHRVGEVVLRLVIVHNLILERISNNFY